MTPRLRLGSLAGAVIGGLLAPRPSTEKPLEVGDQAPGFTLPGTDGRVHSLSELKGRTVVLAWFPKAFTGGCAAECRMLRDSGALLRSFDAAYFMVSTDSPEENRQFAESQKVDFPLLSDPDRAAAAAYGVLGPVGLPRRWTFYIGPDGRILEIDKAVRTASAGTDVAARLRALGVAARTPA
jgi:peroxiredoxin Q/BCP